jgi:hypothetical protein
MNLIKLKFPLKGGGGGGVKDNLRKCKHLFQVGSLPQQTPETAIRYRGIREPVPSSYRMDPLVLKHA